MFYIAETSFQVVILENFDDIRHSVAKEECLAKLNEREETAPFTVCRRCLTELNVCYN